MGWVRFPPTIIHPVPHVELGTQSRFPRSEGLVWVGCVGS